MIYPGVGHKHECSSVGNISEKATVLFMIVRGVKWLDKGLSS